MLTSLASNGTFGYTRDAITSVIWTKYSSVRILKYNFMEMLLCTSAGHVQYTKHILKQVLGVFNLYKGKRKI